MPIYNCLIKGDPKPRAVRAETAAQARIFLVDATPMTAEQVDDLIDTGGKIEKATATKTGTQADDAK